MKVIRAVSIMPYYGSRPARGEDCKERKKVGRKERNKGRKVEGDDVLDFFLEGVVMVLYRRAACSRS
jgi:hypothetical protein